MKKYLSFPLCFMLIAVLVLGMGLNANAVSTKDHTPFSGAIIVSEYTRQVSDHTYMTVTIYEEPINSRASTYTKQGTGVYTLRNNGGEALWQFTVHGTFSVTSGKSATCTNASYSYQIYADSWHYVGASAYYSGNSAYGNAEFNRKLLGITIETETCSLVLSCDAYGNLS